VQWTHENFVEVAHREIAHIRESGCLRGEIPPNGNASMEVVAPRQIDRNETLKNEAKF